MKGQYFDSVKNCANDFEILCLGVQASLQPTQCGRQNSISSGDGSMCPLGRRFLLFARSAGHVTLSQSPPMIFRILVSICSTCS